MQNESKMQKCPKILNGLVSTCFYMYTDRPLASIAIFFFINFAWCRNSKRVVDAVPKLWPVIYAAGHVGSRAAAHKGLGNLKGHKVQPS